MKKSLSNEIIEWNSKFPVDRWWRNKHNISYNSKEHREASFIDMLFEFEEEQMFSEINVDSYKPNEGKWLDISRQTQEQKTLSLIEEARKELRKFNKDAG